MTEKENTEKQENRKNTNSLLNDLLEETRRDAELELIQLEQEQNKKKQEEEKQKAFTKKESQEKYKRELEEEKRRRAKSLQRFEERKKQKESPRPQEQTIGKEPEKTGKFPVWAAIFAGILVIGAAAVAIIMFTRPSNPPVVFNPATPEGTGKAIVYAMANIPFGPATVHYGRILTTEQVILNTTPRPYIVKPKPKKVAKRVRHHVRKHKKRVKIKVKLFSPDSIIK